MRGSRKGYGRLCLRWTLHYLAQRDDLKAMGRFVPHCDAGLHGDLGTVVVTDGKFTLLLHQIWLKIVKNFLNELNARLTVMDAASVSRWWWLAEAEAATKPLLMVRYVSEPGCTLFPPHNNVKYACSRFTKSL